MSYSTVSTMRIIQVPTRLELRIALATPEKQQTHNNQPIAVFLSPTSLRSPSKSLSFTMFSSRSVPFEGIPDDPRWSNVHSPTPEDVSALANNKFLSSRLVEFVIKHSWFLHNPTVKVPNNYHVTPVWFELRLESILRNSNSSFATDQANFNAMKLKYAFLKKGDHTIVIPYFKANHFCVVKMSLNLSNDAFFNEVLCYDSLARVRRIRKSHLIASLLQNFQLFLDKVVLWDMQIPKTKFNVFDVAVSSPCPPQLNGCDCGLFTAVVLSYIVSGGGVNQSTFTQHQISILRKKLFDEMEIENGKVVFDVKFFSLWFPGMVNNKELKVNTTTSQKEKKPAEKQPEERKKEVAASNKDDDEVVVSKVITGNP